jgi:hypothetical protein
MLNAKTTTAIEAVSERDTSLPRRRPYAPPQLAYLGSVADLTRGGTGSKGDGVFGRTRKANP